MSQSGINYFLENYASFSYRDYWKLWLNFKGPTGARINNNSGANLLYSGQLTTSSSYTGIFTPNDFIRISAQNKTRVAISPSTGLWGDQFSLMFLVDKTNSGSSILFNCLETGLQNNQNIYKGYTLGYTDGSKLFFQYYNQDGLTTFNTEFSVNKNHSAFMVKNGDSISLGYYDFYKQQSFSNSFAINSEYLFEPSNYYLGFHTGNSRLDKLNNTGNSEYYLDEFLYFNYPLYDYDIQIINSGFIADFVPAYTGSGIIQTTGITGYTTGTFIISGGITGYGITGTGLFTNEYGVSYTGYASGYLSGNISGSGVINLTGLVNTPNYFLIDESVVINTGYAKTFYPNKISMLRESNSGDYLSLIYETGYIDWLGYNDLGSFDKIENKFKVFQTGNLIVWLNGVAQLSGDRYNAGTIYTPNWIISGDYERTGDYLNSNNFYSPSDILDYRSIIPTYFLGFPLPETSVFDYTGGAFSANFIYRGANTLVFLNGHKIIDGIDYSGVGSNISFRSSPPLYNGATGKISIVNITGKYLSYNNSGQILTSPTGFNENYTMLFMNGIKQRENSDFLFTTNSSLIYGSGNFKKKENILLDNYDNIDPFFEN